MGGVRVTVVINLSQNNRAGVIATKCVTVVDKMLIFTHQE